MKVRRFPVPEEPAGGQVDEGDRDQAREDEGNRDQVRDQVRLDISDLDPDTKLMIATDPDFDILCPVGTAFLPNGGQL